MTLFLLPHRHPADGRVLRQVLRDPRRGRRPADWFYVLAVLTMLNAAIAAFYYLRVVVYMCMRDPQTEQPALPHGRLVWTGLPSPRSSRSRSASFPEPLLSIVEQGRGRG